MLLIQNAWSCLVIKPINKKIAHIGGLFFNSFNIRLIQCL
ncbi:hypothetical protein THOD04_10603 [Vibrio owensii]|nr:hypothetical protein THOD04_10603 [Vibrio owensii]